MEKKSFDISLANKIEKIIEGQPENSPFEWFTVGFIYAHPNNQQTLEKIFAHVHSVISLRRNNDLLTLDDTNNILVKMINNLIGAPPPKQSFLEQPRKEEPVLTPVNTKAAKTSKPVISQHPSTAAAEDEDLSYESSGSQSPIRFSSKLSPKNKKAVVQETKPALQKNDSKKEKENNKATANGNKEPVQSKKKEDIQDSSFLDIGSKTKSVVAPVTAQNKPAPITAKKEPPKTVKKVEPPKEEIIDDDFSYKGNSSEDDIFSPKNNKKNVLKVEPKDIKKDGKVSQSKDTKMIIEKEEKKEEKPMKVTMAMMAQAIQKKSVSKETPVSAVETEDISDEDDKGKASRKKVQVKGYDRLFERQDSEIGNMEKDFNMNKSNSNSMNVISNMVRGKEVQKTVNNVQKNDDDVWGVMSQRAKEDLASKKAKVIQMVSAEDDDVIVDLDDTRDFDYGSQSNSRFKKQVISQVMDDDFPQSTVPPKKSLMELKLQHDAKKQQKAALLSSEPIELMDSPQNENESLILNKNKIKKQDSFDFSEEKPKYVRKPSHQVEVEETKGTKRISREEEERLSRDYIRKLQEEEAGQSKGRRGGAAKTENASKRKKK